MYNFKEIEKKWSKYWDDTKTFKTDVWDFSKPKFYALAMFPYPSAQGLHVGHPESYTATDIVARMKKMQGYNVLHPMGFDSFGLPAEQYAINTGNNPNDFTNENIQTFIKQLKMLGFSYDWDRAVSTTDPKFYKWTQWIFKQLYLDGLAKNIEMPVNWCEELGTVLANDEVVDGKSERGGFPVIKKMMKQWVIDVPKYAEKLISGLDELSWPESSKEMQKNWIGKSQGAIVKFGVDGFDGKNFEVFTTRPETLFGATYCVLAPEHNLVSQITTIEQKQAVENYKTEVLNKTDLERTDLNKNKTGVFTGAYAINPANNKRIPIYISDYVLMSYGTGAIMAVPAHDQRDYEFAKTFGLEIIPVLLGGDIEVEAYESDGEHINSDFLNGLNKEDAISKMVAWLEKNGFGKGATTYRLREWIFARQRYWGEPIPIVYLENGQTYVLDDSELPLVLPELSNYKPDKGAVTPLDKLTDWVNVNIGGVNGKRETSTMPGSAGSSWYYLRYIDPENENEIADKKLLDHWMPVDLYIGGSEHVVGHLIYSRFFNHYLHDKGILSKPEPFKKLVHQGMILGENGIKMSKSLGNVVNPDDIIADYGADALRMYEMFMGPLEATKPWQTGGIVGSKKFLDRVWNLYTVDNKIADTDNNALKLAYNQTVKKVTEDYETLNFNTAISQMMIFINAVQKENVFPTEYAKGFIKLLNPIAPFITEEIWQTVFNKNNSIANEQWPSFNEEDLVTDSAEIIVQVNGKVRVVLNVEKDTDKQTIETLAKENSAVQQALTGKEVVKVVFVPNRLLNFVVK